MALSGLSLRCSVLVETALALSPRPLVAVIVRAALSLRLLLASPCMDEPVMAGAEDDQFVSTWKRLAALGDRVDVVRVEETQALSGNAGQIAASAGTDGAGANLPPGLLVVQRGHKRSLAKMVAMPVDNTLVLPKIEPFISLTLA